MIPSDLAARLRMLTEASFFDSEPPIHGPARVREIQARLPDLAPGTQFTATLERSLPDGTFRAIVAGKSYTLALNHAATAGDTLELVVTQSTPRTVFAQLAPPAMATAESANANRPSLSTVGRLIGFLLTGQPEAQPAPLAAGKAIVGTPPADNAATLAPALRQAVSQSGLFYESHQLQWISGKLDRSALLLEPQGLESTARPQSGGPPAPQSPASGNATATGLPPMTGKQVEEISNPRLIDPLRATPESDTPNVAKRAAADSANSEVGGQSNPSTLTPSSAPRVLTVPERLMPLVHQQLDAMATQNYVWQGQVWPGQVMEWEIEDPQQDRRGSAEDAPAEWNTTLRLHLPRLGGVEARLILTPAGVALRLVADDSETVRTLGEARQQLDDALAAANVPLTGFVAERRDAGR